MNSCSSDGASGPIRRSLLITNNGEEGPGDLSPRTEARALKELNETAERRVVAVAELKGMVARDPKLSQQVVRTDDSFYLRYLRAKKFDVDRAFKLLSNHAHYPERIGQPLLYSKPLTPGQILALESGVVGFLPKRDYAGRKILCLFPGRWNSETMPLNEMHSLVLLIMTMLIESEETQVNGFSALCDATGLGHKQFLSVITNKDLVFHIIHLVQETFPARFKEAVIANQPWYVNLIKTLVFPLIKKKFRERIRFQGSNLINIGENFGKDCLPEEFNGSLKFDPSFNIQSIQEAIENSYPPFTTSSPPLSPAQNLDRNKILTRIMSDDIPSNLMAEKLERSLSLSNIEENFQGALNFQVPTPAT